ncbi:MAG: serine hydrolase domain-containing protein [Pseudomonadota bacterium]
MNKPIHGHCDATFEPLRQAFLANFLESGEIGARVCVIQDGQTVADLWGGYTAPDGTTEWSEETLVNCMSVTKGVVALAAHLLRERGLLDYDAPVADYWPEFAADGKCTISVREAMSHQASLAIIDSAEPGDILDWDRFVAKIAAQAPNWPPGTQESYHSVTIGYITGELVRRIDGRPIQRFIREELAEPLHADCFLGCTEEEIARIVPQLPNPANELMNGGLMNEQTLPQFVPFPEDPAFVLTPDYFRLGFPSGGGVAHAAGLARLFAPLASGGAFNGVQLYGDETLRLMAEEQWNHDDHLFGNDFRVALGLLLSTRFNDWGREGNVGTAGAGGFCAFADPENRLSFGYTPNRYSSGYGIGQEPERLIGAIYESL